MQGQTDLVQASALARRWHDVLGSYWCNGGPRSAIRMVEDDNCDTAALVVVAVLVAQVVVNVTQTRHANGAQLLRSSILLRSFKSNFLFLFLIVASPPILDGLECTLAKCSLSRASHMYRFSLGE